MKNEKLKSSRATHAQSLHGGDKEANPTTKHAVAHINPRVDSTLCPIKWALSGSAVYGRAAQHRRIADGEQKGL